MGTSGNGDEVSPQHLEQALAMHPDKRDDRIDREVAQYAGDSSISIDEATSKRLRMLIDKRILVVMIVTYFMQALDKGTISFVSIMGFNTDFNLHGQQV